MRYILLSLVLTAACGTEDATTYDCDALTKTVGQTRGTCRIDSSGSPDPFGTGCPASISAYCQPDGVSCPTGWTVSCEGGQNEQGHDCTYFGECTMGGDIATFNYVQTLNGVQGLGVMRDDGRCEFRKCNAL